MIVITLPLFAFGGYSISLQRQAVDVDDLTTWLRFQNVAQKVSRPLNQRIEYDELSFVDADMI